MIYIQSNKEKTRPLIFDSACAMYGAIESELQYEFVSMEELISGQYDKLITRNLFVGSSEFMKEVFRRMSKNPSVPINSERPSEITTLGQAIERVHAGEKLFVKPIENKLFTGIVLEPMVLSYVKDYPLDTPVRIYPVLSKILSEWRAYVYQGEIHDLKNYSGDFAKIPDISILKELATKNKDIFPIAYTMDVGILEDGTQTIIEYNDFWAIGNYGLYNFVYLNFLRHRYFEIVRYG